MSTITLDFFARSCEGTHRVISLYRFAVLPSIPAKERESPIELFQLPITVVCDGDYPNGGNRLATCCSRIGNQHLNRSLCSLRS